MTTSAPGGLLVALRDYQEEAHERSIAAEARGVRRQLGVAATGLGKTIIFATRAARRGGRTLVLAHTDELVVQAVEKLLQVWPELGATEAALRALEASGATWLAATTPMRPDGVGIVKAGANDVQAKVVVGSVQTLARPNRLAQLLAPFGPDAGVLTAADPFGLVVVDEAHHAAAPSYRLILQGLEPWQPLLLGVTATPDRADGKGLDDLFDEVVFNYDILWGIRNGYLADLRAYEVKDSQVDLGDVQVRRGEYDQGQVGRLMERAGADELIVHVWTEKAFGRPTWAFLPTVAMATTVAATFNQEGIAAAVVDSKTPLAERRAILQAFANGKLQVVTNCDVLSEGVDDPSVSCIIMAAPTRSRGRYTQRIGRGLRRHPDKDYCLVLDYVGATGGHSLVTVPSLFGLEKDHRDGFTGGGRNLTDALNEQHQEAIDLGRVRAEEVELFDQVISQGIAWLQVPDPKFGGTRYVRPLGVDQHGNKRETVVLARRDAERNLWVAGLERADGAKAVLMLDVPLELAQGVGEDYVRKHADVRLMTRDAAWRHKPPTERQLALAKRVRVRVNPAWTAGELSDAIDARFEHFKQRDREKAKATT